MNETNLLASDMVATIATKDFVLSYVGKEDGQDTWQGLVDNGAILEYDRWEHANGVFHSLTYDLSRNDANLKSINGYKISIAGHLCEFPEVAQLTGETDVQWKNRWQRIMCRTRFTWGVIPPKKSQTFYEFAPLPRQPIWNSTDLATIPGNVGPVATPPPNTGSGEDRSCHHPNWYTSDAMLRSYADADGNWPVAVRDPAAPYDRVARDGFQMGYNAFSHLAWKAGQQNIGYKFQLPHATANSVLAWMMWGDLYYKRSLINVGNYAAMYNAPNQFFYPPAPATKVPCWMFGASEYRGVFRGLNAMLVATSIDGNPWRKKKITDTLAFLDRNAAEPFGTFPKKLSGEMVPYMITTQDGRTFINYWMTSFAFYTIDLAGRLGYTEGQTYLNALMDFQEKLNPTNIGCYFAYQINIKDTTKSMYDVSNLDATNKTTDSEANGFILGEIMRRYKRTPPRPLDGLMLAEGMYPVRNNAAHFIFDSTRPPKPKYIFNGITYNNVDAAKDAAKTYTTQEINLWDGSASLDMSIKIERTQG